jgi:uncharacterized ion transporter superfamily protein YfcC
MVAPTSGLLVAYLSTGRIAYATWIRFIPRLRITLLMPSLPAAAVAVLIGY